MRSLVFLILFIISGIPVILLNIRLKKRQAPLWQHLFVWTIPFIATVIVPILLLALKNNRLALWYLWTFITIFLPLDFYTIFRIVSLQLKDKAGKAVQATGIIIGIAIFTGMLAGMLSRHRINVRETTIETTALPRAFDGLKIVHITDLHLGNLTPQQKYLDKIVHEIDSLHPDILVFTGDLVNLCSKDADNTGELFNHVRTTFGRYAVMGNHDYGDYVVWNSEEEKDRDIQKTKEIYRYIGFTLLNDSAVHIIADNDSIGIIGVENIGRQPFPQYGNLDKAVKGFSPARFNILLTHDPNHWQDDIAGKKEYITLTLSGHTHGAQIGMKCGERKISPSRMIFDYWDGLYRQEDQFLFVSRGLGYVGIPFRLGMRPEISVITLKHKE